uniref:Uncharacterized protein n=1 Tax=Fagus sylvatica TaxID=28930 RepID=A0A2N9I2Z1_FAGSY
MAPKKSVSEGPRKRLKSRAERDKTTSIDNTFRSSDHSIRFHENIAHRTKKWMKKLKWMKLMLKEMKRQCKRIKSLQPHLLAPLRVNEDNFQLMFGRLDSLATSMGNFTTSLDNFSSMVTQRFSTYDENFASLAQSMEEINERLRNHGI